MRLSILQKVILSIACTGINNTAGLRLSLYLKKLNQKDAGKRNQYDADKTNREFKK